MNGWGKRWMKKRIEDIMSVALLNEALDLQIIHLSDYTLSDVETGVLQKSLSFHPKILWIKSWPLKISKTVSDHQHPIGWASAVTRLFSALGETGHWRPLSLWE